MTRLLLADDHPMIRAALEVLLREWRGELAPLSLLCADRRLLSSAVQALREFLVARFAQLPPPPGVT